MQRNRFLQIAIVLAVIVSTAVPALAQRRGDAARETLQPTNLWVDAQAGVRAQGDS